MSSTLAWQRCRLWTEPAGLLRAPQNEKAKQDKYEHNYDCVRILLSRAAARLYRVVLSKRRGYTCSLCHSVFIYVSESVIREFPFQRRYINYVSSILTLFPFPVYVGNRECPEGNQIDAGQ